MPVPVLCDTDPKHRLCNLEANSLVLYFCAWWGRKAATIEVKDVQVVLERSWNMWIPGFGSEEIRPYKRSATTEAHRTRLAVIKKALKKY